MRIIRNLTYVVFLSLSLQTFCLESAWSWGPLGHRIVTETAAILLANDTSQKTGQGWGPLLNRHRFELGFYSTLPDSFFRQNDGNKGETEAPTHFFNLDLALGNRTLDSNTESLLAKFPRGFNEAVVFAKKERKIEDFSKIGTAPWRVEQLLDLSWNELKSVKSIQGTYQTGAASQGDAKRIFQSLYYLGVMAHYSGDAVFPYHATSDWNGWEVGLGGIHFYYEADCVTALEPELSRPALKLATKNQKKWLKEWGAITSNGKAAEPPVGIMLRIFLDSAHAIEPLAKMDRKIAIMQPSEQNTKKFAARKKPEEACEAFRPFLIERLAKGAVLTAYLWDTVLPRNIDFSKEQSLLFADYDLDPAYVQPLYRSTPGHFRHETH